MEQIHESKMLQGMTKPMLFVRYAPTGRIEVDGMTCEMGRDEREKVMMRFLAEVARGERAFTEPLNIVYICYSRDAGTPTICDDPDYSEQMKGCIRAAL